MSIFRSSAYRFNPGDSGNVYQEPVSVSRTTRTPPWGHSVFVFPNSNARDEIYFKISVPNNFGSQPSLIIVWTTSFVETGSGEKVVWDFRASSYGGNNTDNMNSATIDEDINESGNDLAGAIWEKRELSISLTASVYAPGDTVLCELSRVSSNSNDIITADVHLEDVFFQYNDDFI